MSFSIAFDYRFDPLGFYDDPAVRAVMDRAAEIWSGLIGDEFEDVAAGTSFTISNPSVSGRRETIVLEEDIDDLLIFMGARDLPSLGRGGFAGTDAEGDIFRTRISDDFRDGGAVTDFEPWAGVIVLDPNVNWGLRLDAPTPGKNDLLTTVLHEIGHVLGIGTSGAFAAWVDHHGFEGPNAVAANGGAPIPLEHDGAHVAEGHGHDDVLLDPVSTTGLRKLPGALDLAMLADIGYEIAGFATQGTQPPVATEAGELIFGTILDDRIESLGGNDQVQGGTGDDTILAGSGDDTVFGQEGHDRIEGGAGNDQLQGSTGNDTLFGNAGSDTLFGQEGDDFLRGGADSDFLLGGAGNDTLRGGPGDDSIRGGEGADRIVLEPGMGSDTVYDFEFGRDALDLTLLDAGLRASISVSGGDTLKHVRLSGGGEIYLQGTIAPVQADITLGGEAVQDGVLTASFTGMTNLFGVPVTQAAGYIWLRDGAVIGGAGGTTYLPVQADVGAQISVVAQYSTASGLAQVTSTVTTPVRNINDAPTGSVTVSDTAAQGQMLAANTAALADADGLGSLGYQWLRDGAVIEGAMARTHSITAQDAGKDLAVRITYTDGQGTAEVLSSSAVSVAPPVIPLPPEPETVVELVVIASVVEDPVAPETPAAVSEDPAPEAIPVTPVRMTKQTPQEPNTQTPTALVLRGGADDDLLQGTALGDTLYGGAGSDTLIGGAGNDLLVGGEDGTDLRDMIYGGAGNDTIHGSHGNDELRGDGGDDLVTGDFGADTVIGGTGNDTLTGGAFGDQLFGGAGDDFLNGGYGFDQINGGGGADRFFHLGVEGHGSDWIQDFTAIEGDVLVFGDMTARADQFQINSAFTTGAGAGDVAEAFVIYKPTGQILWALVDGMEQDEIMLSIDGTLYDLLI